MDFKDIPPEVDFWLYHPNIEKYGSKEVVWSVRLQTKYGLERLFKAAFVYDKDHGLTRVTFADKPNVMHESNKFAKDLFNLIAPQYSLQPDYR